MTNLDEIEEINEDLWRIENGKTYCKRYSFSGTEIRSGNTARYECGNDLRDTLAANRERCVGMAANMIGYKKNMIIVSAGPVDMIMINPVICSKIGRYETEEGCLSLEGKRKTTRYKKIEVEFQDDGFVKRKMAFEGFVAQIIQHDECDIIGTS